MKTENVFQISDVYLALITTIILKVERTYTVRNNKTFFCFPVSDELYKAMGAYSSGASCVAIEYADAIKRLRAEMLMRRKAGYRHER